MANFNIAYLIELKDRYTKVAQKVAEVNQRLKESVASLDKKMSDFSNRLEDVKGKFKTLSDKGKDAFVGISVPVGLAIGGIIKLGAELEDTEMVFTTMLGSAEKASKMIADVQTMASKTPFGTAELLDATKLMLNFGIASQDIMGHLEMLGNISGGNKQRFQSLALVFSQVQSQGKLMGGDLLQMINAGFNPLQVISEKTGKSMGELKDLMSKGAISAEMVTKAMQIATSEGGRFNELMAKQATTLNGLMSTLADNFALAGAKLGKSLLPYIKPFVETLIKMTNGLADLNPKVMAIILAFTGLAALIPVLMVTVGFLGQSYISFMQTMTMLNSGVLKMVALFSKWNVATKIATAVQAVFNATLWMNPITWIVAGVIALIAVIVLAYQKVDWFRNLVQTLWIGIQVLWTWLKILGITLWQKIQPALQAVSGFFQSVWQKVVGLGNSIKNLWSSLMQVLAPIINFGKFIFLWLTPLGLVINVISTLISKFEFITKAIEKGKQAMQGFKANADATLEAKQRELKATFDANINISADAGTKITKTKTKSTGNVKSNVGKNQASKGG